MNTIITFKMIYLSRKSSHQYNTASIQILIRKTTVLLKKSYHNQPVPGALTEGGKPKSIGVMGFSTEGNEGRLPTDKGPETANITPIFKNINIYIQEMSLATILKSGFVTDRLYHI